MVCADGAMAGEGEHMDRGLGRWVTKRARLQGDKTAFVVEGDRTSYVDLEDTMNRLAHAFMEVGLRRGDRVACMLRNSVELIEVLLACAKLGPIMVPINWRLSAAEIGYILADSGADIFVLDGSLAASGRGALGEHGVRVRQLAVVAGEVGTGETSFGDLVGSGGAEGLDADVAGDDVAVIMYTSGTTGRPKGAMLTHDNLLWNVVNMLGTQAAVRATDVTIAVAPMFHIGGLGVHTLPLLYVGGTSVIMATFDPTETLRAMQEHAATVQFMVPAMWTAVTQVPDFDSYDLSALRLAVGGGAPCPLPMIAFLRERGVEFTEAFGMTETAPLVSVLDSEHVRSKAGSIGRVAMHVDACIAGDHDQEVPAGTVGELLVRGPNVFGGYWMNAQATAEVFRSGWFHTGDLVRMDEEGFITLVDRKKDMIITGGENVYPIEVEHVLFQHPAVVDAAVIGAPDAQWGEKVVAVVVGRPGSEPPNPEELVQWCRQRLAHYKCPKEVRFTEALPRNATGKVLKRELRLHLSGGDGAALWR